MYKQIGTLIQENFIKEEHFLEPADNFTLFATFTYMVYQDEIISTIHGLREILYRMKMCVRNKFTPQQFDEFIYKVYTGLLLLDN